MSVKVRGEVVKNTKFRGWGGQDTCFEGSQAVPARPSRKGIAYDQNYFLHDLEKLTYNES
jgi:hypothetical protein